MLAAGRLSEPEYRASVDAPLRARASEGAVAAAGRSCGGYFQEEVRRQLVARFGGQQGLRGGLRVYTGDDPAVEGAGEKTRAPRSHPNTKTREAARDLQ